MLNYVVTHRSRNKNPYDNTIEGWQNYICHTNTRFITSSVNKEDINMTDFFKLERNGCNQILWNEEQINYIIEEYQNTHSTGKIAQQFKTSTESIRRVLKKNNVKILSAQELQHAKHPRDSNFFNTINTPDKAYWLGFLYADGSVSASNSTVALQLQEQDKSHLIKFRKALGNNNTVTRTEKYDSTTQKSYYGYRYAIRDQQIHDDLIEQGCMPNKTYILTFPDNDILPTNLQSHFIRGYMDGDGHFGYYSPHNRPGINFRLAFYGTESMLKGIQECLNKENLTLESRSSHYVLKIVGNKQLESILKYIYQDSQPEIELDRKREVYDYFILKRFGD